MTEESTTLRPAYETEMQRFSEAVQLKYAAFTLQNCMRSLRHISRRTHDLSREAMMEWLRKKKSGGMTNKTLNHYIRHCNMLLSWRQEEKIAFIKVYEKFVAVSLTDDHVQRVMHAASRGIREPERNYAIVATLFGTGVRLGELAGMKLSDIRADVLTVTGKGQKTREVWLPPDVRKALDEYLRVRQPTDPNYLWTSRVGRCDYNYLRRIIYTIGKKAGVPFHAHAARHHYATRLRASGADLEGIRRLMGHESIETTRGYFDIEQGQVIMEVRRLNPKFFLTVQPPARAHRLNSPGVEPWLLFSEGVPA